MNPTEVLGMTETCRISPELALGYTFLASPPAQEDDAELSDLAKVAALSGLWAGIHLLAALAPSPSQTHQEPLLQLLPALPAAAHPKSLPGLIHAPCSTSHCISQAWKTIPAHRLGPFWDSGTSPIGKGPHLSEPGSKPFSVPR